MNKNSWFISIGTDVYPKLLSEIYNPPKKLFYKGKLEILNKPCVAVVGTRSHTEYGEFLTQKIISELAVLDIAIVSGLAKGIDTIAHEAALENDLPTIAVLGSGINNIYPKCNNNLAEKIEEKGLILSEYEGETEPIDFQFPQRNRIISGLSIAIIVIEAPTRSGALITAKLALDQNREIFTIPGDIDRETSIGPLHLIQYCGAYPVSSGQEIVEILQKQPHLFAKPKPKTWGIVAQAPKEKITINFNLAPNESKIFQMLSKNRAQTLEQIQKKTALLPEKILASLSMLEIQNLIKISPKGYLRNA
jgi:DNA processing protein